MTTTVTTGDSVFVRRARVSTNDGTAVGICIVLTQTELQDLGLDPNDTGEIYYYPQDLSVEGESVRVLRLSETKEDTTIGN